MRRSLSALSLAGLALFVALDIVLVYLAFQHTAASPEHPRGDLPVAEGLSEPAPGPGRADAAGPVEGEQSSRAGTGDPEPLADRRLLLAVSDDGTVLRARTGECSGTTPPLVEVSRDGGETFEPAPPPAAMTAVLDVRAGADSVRLVAADAECQVHVYAADSDSGGWVAAESDELWHAAPPPAAGDVHAPTGPAQVPCTAISLAPVDDSVARVLCEGGTVLGTDDTGLSWVALGTLADGTSITYPTPGDGYGLADTGECPAALMVTADGGASWERLRCFEDATPLAIAADGGLVAVQTSRELAVSEDQGDSWRVVNEAPLAVPGHEVGSSGASPLT
jgi:hypothetical protein